MIDKDYLRQKAEQIRDEYRQGANTATRVGQLLVDMIDSSKELDIDKLVEFFIRKDQDDETEHSLGVGGDLTVGGTAAVDGDATVGGDHTVKGSQTVKGDSLIEGLLSLVKGTASPDFLAGLLGTGFELRKDTNTGRWRLEIDELVVRMVATFFELVISKIRHVGGSIVLSPASMQCIRVEEMDGAYRCYFNASDGNRAIANEFVVGDLARCQSFNLRNLDGGGVKTSFYWRRVVGVGEDYIDLSMTDCASGSGEPAIGDDIVHLGNVSDVKRQNAIILDTTGSDAPSIKQYAHIDSYSLEGKVTTKLSPYENVLTGKFISSVTGKDLTESINDFQSVLNRIEEQNDRELTIWFYDVDPTTDNAPAAEWTTDEDKLEHLDDLYYNREAGRAWHWKRAKDGTYYWEESTDQDTIRALEKASKAQDTADGKRRCFVSQPTDADAYDVGDQWVNATYGDKYINDSLVCIVAKASGETFSIDHWKASTENTTNIIKSKFEVLEGKIQSSVADSEEATNKAIAEAEAVGLAAAAAAKAANDAAGLAQGTADDALKKANAAQATADAAELKSGENATAIVQAKEYISALSAYFEYDETGKTVGVKKGGLLLTSDAAELYVKEEKVDGKGIGSRLTVAESSLKATSDKVEAVNEQFTYDAEGDINGTKSGGLVSSGSFATLFAGQITEQEVVKKADISAMVTKDADGNISSEVKISADQITMTGETVFATPEDVSKAKQEAIDTASTDATTKANTAQSNAEENAATDAAKKVKELKDKLGNMAYKSSVGTDALDATIISGGKILTSLIKADELQVKDVYAESSDGTTTVKIDGATGKLTAKQAELDKASIANATITDATMTNATVDGMSAVNADVSGKITASSGQIAGLKIAGNALTNEGFDNDAYIVIRNDSQDRFMGVGANVDPATSSAITLGRYENHTVTGANDLVTNIAIKASAKGGNNGNYALYIRYGNVTGVRHVLRAVSTSTTLNVMDHTVICKHTEGEITITLPSTAENGQEFWMMSANNKNVKVVVGNSAHKIASSGASFASARWHIYIFCSADNTWYYGYTNN